MCERKNRRLYTRVGVERVEGCIWALLYVHTSGCLERLKYILRIARSAGGSVCLLMSAIGPASMPVCMQDTGRCTCDDVLRCLRMCAILSGNN